MNMSDRTTIILKPVDYSGSGGVVLIRNRYDFIEKKMETLSFSLSKKAIAEEFLIGQEYSIETVSQNEITHVLAITEKHTVGKNRFVEDRHIIPADLSQLTEGIIKKEVIKMATAMKMNNCIGHTEVMLTSRGPVIIETAARPGGDNICFKLVELSTGINMYRNMFNLSINRNVVILPTKKNYAGIQFITQLNKVEIQKKINDKAPVFIDYFFKNKNSNKLKQSIDRLGYFVFCSKNREELIRWLDFYK